MPSQDPTKPRSNDENIAFETGTDRVRNDITGESHVEPEPVGESVPVRIYVVQEGDTLASIARKFYGDENQWLRIRNANLDRLAEAEERGFTTGIELRIPLE